jgi:hypothetical protein
LTVVWPLFAVPAYAQELDSRIRLYDALLADVHGDLESAVGRYTHLSRTLSDQDPTLSESLYWLGHGLYDLGRIDEAREALKEGIRSGTCPRCRDLLGVIDIEDAAITTVPVEWTFEDMAHGLFHPWRVQELGSIEVTPAPWGDAGLLWTTIARPGEPDRLVVGFRDPDPAPEIVRFVVVSTDLVALIDVVAEDDHGRTFSLQTPLPASRGVARRIPVTLGSLVPTDGGAPLDTRHLVLLSIVDRTASRSAGTNSLWIDDFEVR